MLEKAKTTGVFDLDTLKKTPGYQYDASFEKKGALVLIECAERIPCNPCETVCPHGAIIVGDNITNLPTVIPEKCTGCGLCVAICPGLAIFLIDMNYSADQATVMFPYEYLPVPAKGDAVQATDREGRVVCEGVVQRVVSPKSFDQTKVITISIPKEFAHIVRGIGRPTEGEI